jgi:hypothetical protein
MKYSRDRERLPDRVYIEDTRRFSYCVDGIKYILSRHGLSMHQLIKEGIPLEQLEDVDDDHVQQVYRYVKNGRKD